MESIATTAAAAAAARVAEAATIAAARVADAAALAAHVADQDRERLDKLSDRIDKLSDQLQASAVREAANSSHFPHLARAVEKLQLAADVLSAKGCPGFCQSEIDSIKQREELFAAKLGRLEKWAHPPANTGKRAAWDVGKIIAAIGGWEGVRAIANAWVHSGVKP